MTTAHRATWKAAQGGAGEEGSFSLHAPSVAVAARDIPGQTVLKSRAQRPRRSNEELRSELDKRERAAKRARIISAAMLPLSAPGDHLLSFNSSKFHELDADVDLDGDDIGREEENRLAHVKYTKSTMDGCTEVDGTSEDVSASPGNSNEIDNVKQDVDGGPTDPHMPSREDEDDNDDDDDEDDDDEEELRAELMRIRAERAEEKAAAEAAEIADGNPLLKNLGGYAASSVDDTDGESVVSAAQPEFRVRRRWDDDVVFKNQAKNEKKLEPRFINDTIRNDFHRRFMRRYVR